jgi:hypothetical protein
VADQHERLSAHGVGHGQHVLRVPLERVAGLGLAGAAGAPEIEDDQAQSCGVERVQDIVVDRSGEHPAVH